MGCLLGKSQKDLEAEEQLRAEYWHARSLGVRPPDGAKELNENNIDAVRREVKRREAMQITTIAAGCPTGVGSVPVECLSTESRRVSTESVTV